MPQVLLKPVPHTEAAKFIADKPVMSRAVFDQLLPDLQARAFTIKGIEDANLVQNVRDRIAEIPQGADWDQVKIEIADKISPWLDEERAPKRAEMLIRTHGFQSYAVANEAIGERQRAAFPYAQYISMDDDNVRDSHAALDGLILPADSPFWETHTGPWDWGCRCSKVYLSADDVKDIEAADADKKPEERRVLDADRLREIENSGMLTRALPGDNGLPRRYNVARVEREGAYSFNPSTLQMDAAQLSQRYDPEVWQGFENFARDQKLDDGRSVLEWLAAGSRKGDLRTSTGVSPPAPEKTDAPATPPERGDTGRKSPVSAALEIRTKLPVAQQIARTIAVIDRVHDDGALPKVTINAKPSAKNLGSFWAASNRIGVSPHGPWPQMTTAHEIGHLLDHQVLGRRGVFASAVAPELAAWREAVQGSRAVQMIQASLKGSRPVYKAEYFLRDREIWARAYAQYVAVRSRDPEMLRQLDLIRRRPIVGQFLQWSDADFAPIAAAMDDIFKAKGWIA